MTEPDHTYCLACRYILDGLPAPTCPECGRPFDPADSRTYLTSEQIARRPPLTGYVLITATVLSTLGTVVISRGQGIEYILPIWLLTAAAGAALASPIVFIGRKRARWHPWELLAFVLPFQVWLWLLVSNCRPKTLANLGDPFYLVPAIVLAALVRVASGPRHRWIIALGVLVALCVVGATIYLAVPALPEGPG